VAEDSNNKTNLSSAFNFVTFKLTNDNELSVLADRVYAIYSYDDGTSKVCFNNTRDSYDYERISHSREEAIDLVRKALEL
jgi:hypothetical protein